MHIHFLKHLSKAVAYFSFTRLETSKLVSEKISEKTITPSHHGVRGSVCIAVSWSYRKVFRQWSHLNSVSSSPSSLWSVSTCCLSVSARLKARPQKSHRYGLISEWTFFMCRLKCSFRLVLYWHSSHWYMLTKSPASLIWCLLWWRWNSFGLFVT